MLFSPMKSTYTIKTNKSINPVDITNFKKWALCLIASLFFLYEFIQVNIFSSIDPFLLEAFQINSTQLGFLSSIYFYSTVAFILPAGQLLDRFSPKTIILITLFICVLGILGFSTSHTIYPAVIFRFFEGIGSAFCFLASFRIAAYLFPKEKLAFATSIIMTVGMMGGVIAQTPMNYLIQEIGWRNALVVDGLVGVALFLFILKFLILPSWHNKNSKAQVTNYWHSFRTAYRSLSNWSCGAYTCLMNLPMALLGAVWGSLFLEQAHHFSNQHATTIVSMIFIGTIIGAPLAGFIADYLHKRKWVMATGSLTSIIISLVVSFYLPSNYYLVLSLFLLLGIFSSTQILGYPTAAQNGAEEIAASSASVVSFITMSGYIIFQPLFGWVMDMTSKPIITNGYALYSLHNYVNALLIIPIGILFATFFLFFVKSSSKNCSLFQS